MHSAFTLSVFMIRVVLLFYFIFIFYFHFCMSTGMRWYFRHTNVGDYWHHHKPVIFTITWKIVCLWRITGSLAKEDLFSIFAYTLNVDHEGCLAFPGRWGLAGHCCDERGFSGSLDLGLSLAQFLLIIFLSSSHHDPIRGLKSIIGNHTSTALSQGIVKILGMLGTIPNYDMLD